DHVEHARWHPGFLGGANDRIGNAFSGGHMATVRLEYYWAPCRQGSRGIATRRGEGQRKVAGAKYRNRTDADAVLTQIGPRQRLALGQCLVDTCTVKVAATQHLGKQPHLIRGARPLALDAAA